MSGWEVDRSNTFIDQSSEELDRALEHDASSFASILAHVATSLDISVKLGNFFGQVVVPLGFGFDKDGNLTAIGKLLASHIDSGLSFRCLKNPLLQIRDVHACVVVKSLGRFQSLDSLVEKIVPLSFSFNKRVVEEHHAFWQTCCALRENPTSAEVLTGSRLFGQSRIASQCPLNSRRLPLRVEGYSATKD